MQKEFTDFSLYRKEHFKKFCEKYPSCDAGIIGRSILGRDINYYKFGIGKRHIIVVGAHHGMEYITSYALYDFIDFILEKSEQGSTFCGINLDIFLRLFTFWVVPCLNPDGTELCTVGAYKNPLEERQARMNGGEDFSHWQANARGVDLNHNYDFGFAEYKEIENREGIRPGRTRFSGEYPESEPETKSLASLARTLMPSLVVSLHTQGEEIYSSPKEARVSNAAARIAAAVGYSVAQPDGHAAFGGFCDYTGGVLGIPSFTVELGRGENPLPHSAMKSICDRTRKLLVLLPTYL